MSEVAGAARIPIAAPYGRLQTLEEMIQEEGDIARERPDIERQLALSMGLA